jgi:hypothetical protein
MAGIIAEAVKSLRVQEFRTSGTFPVPSGVKTAALFLVGGGGGGGANAGQPGNILEINYDVSGKASCTVIIGAGGAFMVNGGNTSFDGVAIANGGICNAIGSQPTAVIGKMGFGGMTNATTGNAAPPLNGALAGSNAPANTGAGAPALAAAGGSGYARVEWYE